MVLPAILDPSGPLDDSIGAVFIGMVVSAILYGLCLLQTFLYFQKYVKDPWYTKTAVATLVTFDTIHMIIVPMGVYHYVIANYHDPSRLQYLTWPITMEGMFVVFNSTIVQVFYIYRAWRLSKGYFHLFLVFILLLLCGNFCTSITWISISMKMSKWYELSRISSLAIAVLVLSCSIDVLIAGSLCILLNRARTGFKRSNTVINRLTIFVISTGLLTAIFAIVALVCMVSMPYNLIYGGFYLCIGRLYTNSFLTTLNARAAIGRIEETELKSSSGTAQRNINIRIESQTAQAARDKEQGMSTSMTGRNDDSDVDLPSQKGHY